MKSNQTALYLSLLSLGICGDVLPQGQLFDQVENLFTQIYRTNFWQSRETVSGPGSELKVTNKMRQELSDLLKRFNITSIADAPCGDCNWVRFVDIGDCTYTGYEIVRELVERNTIFFGHAKKFKHHNLIEDVIEKADLIICRDMLAHLTNEQIFKVLNNFKASGSKYILVTTNTDSRENLVIERAGDWRKLNLELPPFNFPRPLAIINEETPFAWESGKQLALWFLDDINV